MNFPVFTEVAFQDGFGMVNVDRRGKSKCPLISENDQC